MKGMFPGYFANNSENIKGIWEDCLFVLDANVLLNLYRYSAETSSELFEIFTLLHDRLWVPNQVAKEYLNNRVSAISQQVKVYDDALKGLAELKKAFENPKQHPFLSEGAMKGFLESHAKLVQELGESKGSYLSKIERDDIKDRLEDLLDGRVGNGLTNDEALEVISLGQVRYSQKVPPGYKDAKKGGDSEVLDDKLKPFGDYIVWTQTIQKAKKDNVPVVFVTGDSKEDWWTIYSGKPLEPHPQLVDEFVQCVGRSFYMYLPEVFMEKANEYLKRVTSQRAMEEIVVVREEDESQLTDSLRMRSVKDGVIHSSASEIIFVEHTRVEKELSSVMSLMSTAEAKLELTLGEQDNLLARHALSLKGSAGAETLHSINLNSRIRDNASILNVIRRELSGLKNSYSRLSIRLSEINAHIHDML